MRRVAERRIVRFEASFLMPVPAGTIWLLAPARSRRGSMLLIAMVCLLVMMTMFGALLQITQATRLQVRREALRHQARWLAESGASRGAATLKADPEYTGEAWSIPAADLGGEDSGLVTIVVRRENDVPVALEIVADFPAESPDRVRYERSWPLRPAEGSTEIRQGQ